MNNHIIKSNLIFSFMGKGARSTTSGGGIGGYTPLVTLTVNVTKEPRFDVETSPAGVEGRTET